MKKILATVLFLVMTAVALSGCLLDSSEARRLMARRL